MAPGASGFADLQASVMRLMELPPETTVHPGHREPTTIGAEREGNPFVQIWRGEEETGEEQVTVWGRPATMKLWAPDYDGGNKAWVVFGDDGTEAIVGGSQVERLRAAEGATDHCFHQQPAAVGVGGGDEGPPGKSGGV